MPGDWSVETNTGRRNVIGGHRCTFRLMSDDEMFFLGTPGQPLGGCMRHFNVIEANMKLRREEVMNLLNPDDECVLSMTCFPR